jgi:uncharacterized protein (TIGR02391 family)
MSDLKTIDKQILENLFQMGGGYVLDFSDRTMAEFFDDELDVDIESEEYNYASGSKANRMRGFWSEASNELVAKSIEKLIEYIEYKLLTDEFDKSHFTDQKIKKAREIAESLRGDLTADSKPQSFGVETGQVSVSADIVDQRIEILLNESVFSHVQGLLEDGHYSNAVEEAYKIVREKLRDITNEEQAHKAFSKANSKKIFESKAKTQAEEDFRKGVKFLHMAIQNLRNEKAHTPAREIDKNLAVHYIVLASLGYDLVNRN